MRSQSEPRTSIACYLPIYAPRGQDGERQRRCWPRAGICGLEQLLHKAHSDDLEQAHHTCVTGLLAQHRLNLAAFRALGRRVMDELIEPARRLAR